MDLQTWIEKNNLSTSRLTLNNYLTLNDLNYYILPEKDKVITNEFTLNISDDEFEEAEKNECEYIIFKFGGKYYYTPFDLDNEIQFNIFRYIGQSNDYIINYPFLGVHGKYELMNGTREYEDWVTKAKFLGIRQLGLAEKNTLAGTIAFQEACKNQDIKPILGETIIIGNDKNGREKIDAKVYIVNKQGWQNLLRINKFLNVDNVENKFIYIWDLINYAEGLILVLQNCNIVHNKLGLVWVNRFRQNFYNVLFQFDSVEYESDQKDKEYLDSLQLYLKKWKGIIPPVLINDAYYLEKEDSHIKIILNELDKGISQYKSNDQYFKSLADNYNKLNELFKNDEKFDKLIEEMLGNLEWLVGECNFEINLSEKYLPKFEYEGYENSEDLFFELLEKGFEEKVSGKVENEDIYIERLENEIDLIKKGNVIDYFLSVWDIINWCADNDILTGPGRGSGAGSLVTYLLGITQIDPIKFKLLFERFLNNSRIKKELPDLDIDYESLRRKEVKNYLVDAYGDNYVTAIGTYQTMQLRATIKELGRENGLEEKDLNYITKLIDFALGEDITWGSLFKKALDKPQVKEFVQNNFQLINDIRLCLGMPKSQGVHAAGMIVVPKKDSNGNEKQVYDWMPVKDIDGNLVSEWEGSFVEKAGFLKHDVLGLTQLDILSFIKKQLKENKEININLEYDIPFGDSNVFSLFQKGYTEDVFQFTSTGLKAYCQDLKPDSIEDLIAAVALYRPGPMESNMHYDYIKLKYKEKEPEYDYMLENVTKETYGLYIYQEQIMKSVQVLGNLDLDSSEKVRKAIGKKIYSEMEKWKDKFIEGAKENGCEEYEAIKIWNKFEAFAKYSFNRSHSTSYAILGYWSAWLKYYYPLEFWTASFEFADDNEVSSRITELSKLNNGVEIVAPDINSSKDYFTNNINEGKIYWSLNKIKMIGKIICEKIVKERNKNGDFFSLSEFRQRVPKKDTGKNVLFNLILAGAFDQVENIKDIRNRNKLIKQWAELTGSQIPEEFTDNNKVSKKYFWILKQKELTGLGVINYKEIFEGLKIKGEFIESNEFFRESIQGKENVVIGGVFNNIVKRHNKKGKFVQLELETNDNIIYVTVWNDVYEKFKTEINQGEGQILIVSGVIKLDKFKQVNVLHTNEKTNLEFFA